MPGARTGPRAEFQGLTATAQKASVDAFTAYGNQRFGWFWRSGHDWIPDLDNGGGAMSTLQLMLLQTDGRRILLLPAWPPEWTADFKLHAPYQTTVEGHVEVEAHWTRCHPGLSREGCRGGQHAVSSCSALSHRRPAGQDLVRGLPEICTTDPGCSLLSMTLCESLLTMEHLSY